MDVLEVRDLEGYVVGALKARARNRGVTLEDEIRDVLTRSVDRQREDYLSRLNALRSAARTRFAGGRSETGPA